MGQPRWTAEDDAILREMWPRRDEPGVLDEMSRLLRGRTRDAMCARIRKILGIAGHTAFLSREWAERDMVTQGMGDGMTCSEIDRAMGWPEGKARGVVVKYWECVKEAS